MVGDLVLAAFEQKKLRAKVVVEAENITTLIELIKEEERYWFFAEIYCKSGAKNRRLKGDWFGGNIGLRWVSRFFKKFVYDGDEEKFLRNARKLFPKRGMEGGREKKI